MGGLDNEAHERTRSDRSYRTRAVRTVRTHMKITGTDVFWWIVIGFGTFVIIAGCTAMVVRNM